MAREAEYDWTLGHCARCGAFVRDGQGLQEEVLRKTTIEGKIEELKEILRYCWKCWKALCAEGESRDGKPVGRREDVHASS